MKLFILLGAVIFAIYHFSSGGGSAAAKNDVELLFDPSGMTESQKADIRVQLEQSLAEIDDFIANPPTFT